MRKFVNAVALVGDFVPGAMMIVAGFAIGISGVTGALWH